MKTNLTPLRKRAFLFLAGITSFLPSLSPAQLSAGTVTGSIRGWKAGNAADLVVRLEEVSTSTSIGSSVPDQSGTFTFRNVPFAVYAVNVVDHNVVVMQQRITVKSIVPVVVSFDSLREYRLGEIAVEGSYTGSLIVIPKTTTHTLYTLETIEQLPTVTNNKAIESILLNTPGVVPDEDGRLHVRGEDAQLQYVVEGIPITGNLTRVYSSLFNASLIKSVDVQTGGLNAEYGVATSGIVAVTTKSGFDRPLFVHASALVGSFDNKEAVVEVGGNMNGNTGLYVAASSSSSNRYLDPITDGNPNHDDGTAQSFFGKLNTLFSEKVDLTVLGMYDQTKFSIPNQFEKVPPQDQRQALKDYMIGGRLNVQLGGTSVLSGLGYARRSQAEVTSGGLMQILTPADSAKAVAENEKMFIGGKRKYTTTGGQLEFSSKPGWFSLPNNFKAGVAGEVYPVSEFFTFAITNPALSNPDTVGGDDRYLPYDITQGGKPFLVDQSKTGNRFSGYVQDEVQSGQWTFNVGVRFDAFKLLESESAVSPRVAAAYVVTDDLVLRASYNRVVMQAPLENYLVSSSDEAQTLVGTEQGNAPTRVRSEKADVFELGGAYQLNRFIDFDLSAYTKFIDDFIVKVELANSGVIFPVNLKQGLVAGGELRVRLRDWNRFSGFLSFSTCVSRGLVPEDGSTPFAAGLVLGEEGEAYSNPFKGEDSFPTEHNQLLTAAFGITYLHPAGLFATIGGRFDSGLPFDLTGPQGEPLDEEQSRQELLRRGYTEDVIDLLDLAPETAGSPDRSVAPHAVFDAAAGFDFAHLTKLPLRLTLTVLNVFDTPYLYKFESTFGGTHFGVPRTASARLELNY
jgi:hypothetical protein